MYAQADLILTWTLSVSLSLFVGYAVVLIGNVYANRRLSAALLSPFARRCREAILRGVMAGRYQMAILVLSIAVGAMFDLSGLRYTALLAVAHGMLCVLFYSTLYALAVTLKQRGLDLNLESCR